MNISQQSDRSLYTEAKANDTSLRVAKNAASILRGQSMELRKRFNSDDENACVYRNLSAGFADKCLLS